MLMSIFLILCLGFLANKLFKLIKLPGLLGMILVGIVVGPYGIDLIESSVLDISSDIRMMALIIILLRAGLGINKDTLKSVGAVSLKMSFIPCVLEGFTIMMVSKHLLDLTYFEAGMLGFIISAVSPAVIVPFMIDLKERNLGMERGIPIIILAGASIDDIFAITIFSTFLSLYFGDSFTALSLLGIPLQIAGGLLLGLAIGYVIYRVYDSEKIFSQNNEKLLIVLSAGMLMILIERKVEIAGLLGVMSIGFYLLEKLKDKIKHLEKNLNDIWFFAQIFLFVLIGAEVNISVALDMGIKSIVIISIGILARGIGVAVSLHRSNLNLKEKLFCAISYIPKATVQAAIGAIPLSKGVEAGESILAISVLAILITAPIGAIGMELSSEKLLR
jgi:solute carrier family 9B (sodium/hydrogen exchanger), member 1/2